MVRVLSSGACCKLHTTGVSFLRYALEGLRALFDVEETESMLDGCLFALGIRWLDVEATRALLDASGCIIVGWPGR